MIPLFRHIWNPSDKKKYHRLQIRKGYTKLYVRNAHYSKIPDWNILCVNFSGFKIARFYDKTFSRILKKQIAEFIKIKRKCLDIKKGKLKVYSDKKLVKLTLSQFKAKFGKYLVLNVMGQFIKERVIYF